VGPAYWGHEGSCNRENRITLWNRENRITLWNRGRRIALIKEGSSEDYRIKVIFLSHVIPGKGLYECGPG
jgi:hypothetical protein